MIRLLDVPNYLPKQTKKLSSFAKGTARWMCCIYPCRNNLLCKSTYSQMHRKLQPWWIYRRWLLGSVLQVEISHPEIGSHIFCSPRPSNIYGKSDFVRSVSRSKLKKYKFLWFKIRLLFLMEGKYKSVLPKICWVFL